MISAYYANITRKMDIVSNSYSSIALQITSGTSAGVGIDSNIYIQRMGHFTILMNWPIDCLVDDEMGQKLECQIFAHRNDIGER